MRHNSSLSNWFGRKSSSRRREAPPRFRPNFEALETRLTPDTKTLGGLDFVALANFSTNGGQVSVSGPIVVRVAGEQAPLLAFSNGVTFQDADPAGLFTPLGTVSASSGQSNVQILNGTAHAAFKAGDLLSAGPGITFAAGETAGVAPITLAGVNFTPSSLYIGGTANAHMVRMQGSVALPQLGSINVSLTSIPQKPFVEVSTAGPRFGIDFDVALQNTVDISFGTQKITPQALQLSYRKTTDSNNLPHNTFTIKGAATFQIPQAENPISVSLGEGIVIEDGQLNSFQMLVENTNAIKIGSLTITPLSLQITYAKTTDDANQTHTTFTASGAASFQISPLMSGPSTIRLGTPATDENPETAGLVITDGKLTQVDFIVDSTDSEGNQITLDFNRLTLTPHNLHFNYTVDETKPELKKFGFSGGLGIVLKTSTDKPDSEQTEAEEAEAANNAVSLALVEQDGKAGLEVQQDATGTTLTHFRAQVTANFSFKKLTFGVEEVTFAYDKAANTYQFDGTVKVSVAGSGDSKFDLAAKFGDGMEKHGLLILGSTGTTPAQVQSVYLVVNGGFTLKGFSLNAKDVTIEYDRTAGQLRLAGGVDVVLNDKLGIGGMISPAKPLLIDTKTGQLSVGPDGLDISGELKLGTFSATAFLSYKQDAVTGLDLKAGATLHLPQNIEIEASFALKSGKLSDIELVFKKEIAIGTTGFFITSIGGGLHNLDNLTNLVVQGSIDIRFGKTIKVGGTDYDLLTARGEFLLDKDHLELSANAQLVGGKLGHAEGKIDINWTTGVFKVDASLGLINDLITAQGSLYLDKQGNVTFSATVALTIPSPLPFAGTRLASGSLYLQVRPNQDSTDDFVQVYGSIGPFNGGFQFNFDGSSKFLGPQPVTVLDTRSGNGGPGTVYNHIVNSIPLPLLNGTEAFDYYTITVQSPFFKDPKYTTPGVGSSSAIKIRLANGATGPITPAFRELNYDALDGSDPRVLGVAGTDTRTIRLPLTETVLANGVTMFHMEIQLFSKYQLVTINGDGTLSDQPKIDFRGHMNPSGFFAPVTATFVANQPTPTVLLHVEGATHNIEKSKAEGNTSVVTINYFNTKTGATGLIKEVNFDGPTLDPGLLAVLDNNDGRFTLNYLWTGLPALVDAAQLPYDQAKQPTFIFYASISDHINPIVYTPAFTGVPLIPPNPTPTGNSKLFLEPTKQSADFLPYVSLADVVLIGQSTPRINLAVSLNAGDVGGYFASSMLNDPLLTTPNPKSFEALGVTTAEAQAILGRMFFITTESYAGLSYLNITLTGIADAVLITDTVKTALFPKNVVIPIVYPNANLLVTQRVDKETPKEGDLVTFTTEITNGSDGGNSLDAKDVAVLIKLSTGMTPLTATTSLGSFSFDTGLWTIGDLALNSGATLTIQARVDAGTVGTPLNASATAKSTTRIVYLDDATDIASLHAVGTGLELDSKNPVAGYVVTNPDGSFDSYAGYQFRLARNILGFELGGVGGPYTYQSLPNSTLLAPGARAGLPPGLTLSKTGYLSGKPTVNGIYQFDIGVADGLGTFASLSYTLAIGTEYIPANLPLAFGYKSYKKHFDQLGTFVVLPGGNLPDGLAIDLNGNLGGTATTPGVYSFTVRSTYVNTALSNIANTITYFEDTYETFIVQRPPGYVVPALLPFVLTTGQAVTPAQLSVLNLFNNQVIGDPLTYTVTSGVLPPGITLSTSGVLGGTPTNNGVYQVVIKAVDEFDDVRAAKTYVLTVGPTGPSVTLPGASAGVVYRQVLGSQGAEGTGPFTFAAVPGAALNGLTLSPSGVLIGTPNAEGTFTFGVNATSSDSKVTTMSITLVAGQRLSISPDSLPAAVASPDAGNGEIPYSQQLTASGGSSQGFSFTLDSGSLPFGLSLTRDGLLAGVPRVAGVFRFSVMTTDSRGATGTQNFTLTVSSLLVGTVDVAYSQALPVHMPPDAVPGLDGPFTSSFTLASGVLPGMTLSPTGILTGTPQAEGRLMFSVAEVVHDQSGRMADITFYVPYVLQISRSLALTPSPLTAIPANDNLNLPLTASGGSGTGYTYSIVSGALPTGLALNAKTGSVTGKAQVGAASTFTVKAVDNVGTTGSRSYTLTPFAEIVIQPAVLTDLVIGQSFSRQLTAQGGSGAPYKFSVTSGTLPKGLTLSYGGLVSGTPTVAGSGTLEIMAVDTAGFNAFATFSVVVGTAPTGNPGSLAFSQATATFAEGATATITLTRTGGTSGSVSVSIRVADENIGNRQSGIAVKGVDYTLPATVITFADGQASQTFQVPIALDQLIEQHETLTLVIDQPTGGATLGQKQTCVVTILSRDGTSTQRYVAQAFQDLLKRTVDGGGLSYWSGLIDQGSPRSLISQMLSHSDEYFATNVIKPSYSQFLNREADQTGLDYWTQQLQSGVTDEQMQAGFIASNEFFSNSGGTDLLWVRGLYQALLGRLPDQTGEGYWTQQLADQRTRTEVANQFTGSKEGLSLRVQQTYQRYLGRPADQGGLDYWLAQYALGAVNEDIVTGFIGSDEYFSQANK